MHPYKVTKDLLPEREERGKKNANETRTPFRSLPQYILCSKYLLWNHHQMTFCHPAEADTQPVSKLPSPKMVLSLTSVTSLLYISKELNNTNQVS